MAQQSDPQLQWISGLDILGKGYDVFGRFAHPSGVYNASIFRDFTKKEDGTDNDAYDATINGDTFDVPANISIVEEHASKESYVQGSSVSEFQSSLDIKVSMKGNYSYYSGEANFGFHSAKKTSQELYYTRFSALVRAYRLALPNTSQLRELLDSDFASMLNSTDNSDQAIDAFFDRYGTHFLAEVVLGGCNNYYATVEKSSVSSSMEIEASVKASYNSLFTSATVSVDTSYDSSQSSKSTHSETGIETVGGDETKAPLMLDDPAAYAEWLDTVAREPALVDFTDQSLRPIWELCAPDNTERRTALELRFNILSGQGNSTATRGTVQHGAAIYPPWGKKDDWNLFVTPASVGLTEGEDADADSDNALLAFDYGIDNGFAYPDHWQIKAKYRYRTVKNKDENGNYQIKWYEDGWVNYLLIPKYTHQHLSLTDLNYDTFDYPFFLLNDQQVYEFQVKKNDVGDIVRLESGQALYENVHCINDSFYEQVEVSRMDKYDNVRNQIVDTPENMDDWNLLSAIRKVEYTEDSVDKDADNSMIRWDWSNSFQPELSTYNFGKFKFLNNVKYRKSNNGKDESFITKGAHYTLLWVKKEFSYWTGCYGQQTLQLPPGDQKMDDWELITTPIRVGDYNESDNSELKDTSLLMATCDIMQGDLSWEVNGEYRWVAAENDPSSVTDSKGQVECLFVKTAVLADNGLPISLSVVEEEVPVTEEEVVAEEEVPVEEVVDPAG